MLSDGRLLDLPLLKASCESCGCVSHLTIPSSESISAWYSEGYTLSTTSPKADEARAAHYCRWIASVMPERNITSVLEIGSGSGALLKSISLTLPRAQRLFGCDPSRQGASSDRLAFIRGTVDNISAEDRFDLILAVNVLEHIPEPAAFLSKARERLMDGGEIVIVCPDADLPNLELLFLDHIFSYTGNGMDHLTSQSGLIVIAEHVAPMEIGNFRLYRLRCGSRHSCGKWRVLQSGLAQARVDYVSRWANLDDWLLEKVSRRRTAMFGGGQMAALLRAYAPKTWRMTTRTEVDDPTEAWKLGKEVVQYHAQHASEQSHLLAVSPASQDRLAARILRDGGRPIRFDNIIPR